MSDTPGPSVPKELIFKAAAVEGMTDTRMAALVAQGKVVIFGGNGREHPVCATGENCKVKINVNIGTSMDLCDLSLEKQKAEAAIAAGAHTLMDLSTGGDLPAIRREILSYPVPVGTVPIYEAVRRAGSATSLEADLLFKVIREHCEQGVDFLTLHCGVNREVLSSLHEDPRKMGVVSRGGAFHTAMMMSQGIENPLYSEFDYLCEILKEYGVVASLGDGMRPGCQEDAMKAAKSVEYVNLGRLAEKAHKAHVQRMIEGPGHMPLDQIGYNVKFIKELTHGAPLYLLGPLVTDIGAGYDHVVGAIGGAVACQNGANFLCMVSPSEHLALPGINDIIEGTRVCLLAAHIGDTLQGREEALVRELEMGNARADLDWKAQYNAALFPDLAKKVHDRDNQKETCSMCGDLCAVKMVRELFHQKKDS